MGDAEVEIRVGQSRIEALDQRQRRQRIGVALQTDLAFSGQERKTCVSWIVMAGPLESGQRQLAAARLNQLDGLATRVVD
jgi:ABC-type bacteriocin/lantibiotic exporter with double-glycine peptidase domain